MLTALCKMIPNSKAHSQKDLNSIYTLSTPASKGVENIDALLDTGSTKGVSKPLHPFKAKHRRGAGRIPANVIPVFGFRRNGNNRTSSTQKVF